MSRLSRSLVCAIASVGHASTQALHPSAQRDESMRGAPEKRSGSFAGPFG